MSDSRSARGIWSVLIGLVFLASVSVADARWFGHETKATTVSTTINIPGRAGNLQSADKAIGMRVENLQGEKLGSIKDLVVNGDRNKVNFVLLSSGTKLYPVPWEAFGSGAKYYTLDITTDSLNGAPTIGSSEIDRLKNPDMVRQINDFYSKMIPSREEGKHFGFMKSKSETVFGPSEKDTLYKCSAVLGSELVNPEGKKIAKLSDVVFDVRNGKLDYGLAGFGGIVGIRTKTAAVPWSAITLNIPERRGSINADVGTLDSAVLAKGDINRLNEPMFASRIDRTFSREGHIYGYVPPTTDRGSTAAWLEGSEYNKMFNTNNITTVEGTIKSIDTFTPEKGALEGLKLKIETPSGETMVIHAGPQAYYMSQNVRFSEGDKVTITGSKVKSGFRSYIMASEIKRGSDTLTLRDSSGKPEWRPEVLEKPVTPPVEK